MPGAGGRYPSVSRSLDATNNTIVQMRKPRPGLVPRLAEATVRVSGRMLQWRGYSGLKPKVSGEKVQ